MTKSTKTKPNKKSKPLHIEIHGEGIDINATFEGGGGDSMSRKQKADAWATIIRALSSIKIGSSTQHSTMTIEGVAHVIRMASPEDLEVIQAALRARVAYDAQDAAGPSASDAQTAAS